MLGNIVGIGMFELNQLHTNFYTAIKRFKKAYSVVHFHH